MGYLGERLAHLRKEKGLSQAELARLLGLGQSTIAMYEKNRRTPDPATLERLADFFHVSVDYLLGRTGRSLRSETTKDSNEASFFMAPELRQTLIDPMFSDLLKRIPSLTREEKESLAEHWSWALSIIEKARLRRKKALTGKNNPPP